MFELTANPWSVREADFPLAGTASEQLSFLLNYALLAPSEYNTQPWLFRVSGRRVELYADWSRRLPVVDPDDRELIISCGAAFLNLRVAVRYFGYVDETDIPAHDEHPDLLAHLRLGKSKPRTAEEHLLFHAILQRRSNRHAFADQSVPAPLLSTFERLAEQEGAWFHVVQGEDARQATADMITEGDQRQWRDRDFRHELASWVRPRGMESYDGLPGYALPKGSFASSISPSVIRTWNMSSGEVAKNRQLVIGSPVLAVLGTATDTWPDWFAAGQAAEKILLHARAEDVWGSFVNQPIEVPSLRAMLHDLLGCRGFPQLVLRMGYGPEVPPTPRRSVSEVLLSSEEKKQISRL